MTGERKPRENPVLGQSAAWANVQRMFTSIEMPDTARFLAGPLSIADSVTPALLRSIEIASTARITNALAASTALSASRYALLTESTVEMLSNSVTRLSRPYEQMADLLSAVRVTQDLTKWVTSIAPGSEVLSRVLNSGPGCTEGR